MINTASIEIDGEVYKLAFDFWSFKEIKRVTGKDMLMGEEPGGVDDIVALFWAAMLRHHPDMTVEQASHLIHPGNLQEIVDTLTKLTGEAFPEGAEDGEAKN